MRHHRAALPVRRCCLLPPHYKYASVVLPVLCRCASLRRGYIFLIPFFTCLPTCAPASEYSVTALLPFAGGRGILLLRAGIFLPLLYAALPAFSTL